MGDTTSLAALAAPMCLSGLGFCFCVSSLAHFLYFLCLMYSPPWHFNVNKTGAKEVFDGRKWARLCSVLSFSRDFLTSSREASPVQLSTGH